MHINRCETRTISIAAPPNAVLDFVADPRHLPQWAPGFARAVRPAPEAGQWLVDDGDREFSIAMPVDRAHGTVDILRPGDTRRGAYMRVVPNGAGSEYVFTLVFPDGVPEPAVAAQMQTVEAELATVRSLIEEASEVPLQY
jgi:uncharacterized protein YndB with AHSA1/START domain